MINRIGFGIGSTGSAPQPPRTLNAGPPARVGDSVGRIRRISIVEHDLEDLRLCEMARGALYLYLIQL